MLTYAAGEGDSAQRMLTCADVCWRMQVPKEIPDATAVKPADWNEEDDGAWEPPLVPNPAYAGAQVYEALSYY